MFEPGTSWPESQPSTTALFVCGSILKSTSDKVYALISQMRQITSKQVDPHL